LLLGAERRFLIDEGERGEILARATETTIGLTGKSGKANWE